MRREVALRGRPQILPNAQKIVSEGGVPWFFGTNIFSKTRAIYQRQDVLGSRIPRPSRRRSHGVCNSGTLSILMRTESRVNSLLFEGRLMSDNKWLYRSPAGSIDGEFILLVNARGSSKCRRYDLASGMKTHEHPGPGRPYQQVF